MIESRTKLRILTALAAAVLAGFWLYALLSHRPSELDTASKLADDIRSKLQVQLKKKNNAIGKFVEGAHRTVRVGSAEIVKCAVITTDGGEKIDDDLSNLTRVDIVIRVRWYEEWLDREGESEVHYTLVPRDGKLHPTAFRIGNTTAYYTRAECR